MPLVLHCYGCLTCHQPLFDLQDTTEVTRPMSTSADYNATMCCKKIEYCKTCMLRLPAGFYMPRYFAKDQNGMVIILTLMLADLACTDRHLSCSSDKYACQPFEWIKFSSS
jgi:hypothetical protein